MQVIFPHATRNDYISIINQVWLRGFYRSRTSKCSLSARIH